MRDVRWRTTPSFASDTLGPGSSAWLTVVRCVWEYTVLPHSIPTRPTLEDSNTVDVLSKRPEGVSWDWRDPPIFRPSGTSGASWLRSTTVFCRPRSVLRHERSCGAAGLCTVFTTSAFHVQSSFWRRFCHSTRTPRDGSSPHVIPSTSTGSPFSSRNSPGLPYRLSYERLVTLLNLSHSTMVSNPARVFAVLVTSTYLYVPSSDRDSPCTDTVEPWPGDSKSEGGGAGSSQWYSATVRARQLSSCTMVSAPGMSSTSSWNSVYRFSFLAPGTSTPGPSSRVHLVAVGLKTPGTFTPLQTGSRYGADRTRCLSAAGTRGSGQPLANLTIFVGRSVTSPVSGSSTTRHSSVCRRHAPCSPAPEDNPSTHRTACSYTPSG